MTYPCHPTHLHSTPNILMRVFFGLNITSRVAISKVVLKIQPYDPKQDVLGLLSDADAKEYVPLPVKSKDRAGVLEVVAPAISTAGEFADWEKVLTYLAYKLDIPRSRPHECPLFTNDQYPRTFSVYLIDRYGRYSNVVTRKLKVITSVIMYSNAKPVIISNAAAFTSLVVRQHLNDPVRRYSNISTVDAIELGLPNSQYTFP